MELVAIFFLAMMVEGIVEFFLAPLVELAAKWVPPFTIRYLAMIVGIAICILYQIDLLAALIGLEAIHPLVGFVLSGILMGRGSNYIHDLIGKWGSGIVGPDRLLVGGVEKIKEVAGGAAPTEIEYSRVQRRR